MRMLLKATMDTPMANQALQEGTMQQRLQEAMERLQPEASYFYAEDGKRAALFILELEDPSQIPPVVEPFFLAAGASIHLTPVMSGEDL